MVTAIPSVVPCRALLPQSGLPLHSVGSTKRRGKEEEQDDRLPTIHGSVKRERPGGLGDYNGAPFEVDGCAPEAVEKKTMSRPPGSDPSTNEEQDRAKEADSGVEEFGASATEQKLVRSYFDPVPCERWARQFLRQVLGARTKFSCFIMKTISTSRSSQDDITATALFPILYPYGDVFGVGPDLSSKKKRHAIACKTLIHLMVMAMNYEYFRTPSVLQLFRRHPIALHRKIFERVGMFLKACLISVAGCGRKKFQLDARLRELEAMLSSLGLSSASVYHRGAAGHDVPANNDACEGTAPSVLTGSNSAPHLSDLLYMPFVEPGS